MCPLLTWAGMPQGLYEGEIPLFLFLGSSLKVGRSRSVVWPADAPHMLLGWCYVVLICFHVAVLGGWNMFFFSTHFFLFTPIFFRL